MVNRKKRLEKGINSIGWQIEWHEEKKALAKERKEIDLERYYEKELKGLRAYQKKKKTMLEKA